MNFLIMRKENSQLNFSLDHYMLLIAKMGYGSEKYNGWSSVLFA